ADKPPSVHLAEFPEPDTRWDDPERDARWDELLELRQRVLVALEGLRKDKRIGSAQEARVRIATSRPERWLPLADQLATLCIVSEVEIARDPAAAVESITADRSTHAKCERCWNYRPTVGRSPLHPTLCERCAGVMDVLSASPGK